MPVNLDLSTLKQKYPNIAGFYCVSCTQKKRLQGRVHAVPWEIRREFEGAQPERSALLS
jgi:hypothetical protein